MKPRPAHEKLDDGHGVPVNLKGSWLYGGHGPATERHMRVRDRNGRGYSSAHPGSAAAEARLDQLEQAMEAAGLPRRQREALQLAQARHELPAIAERMGLTYNSAKSLLRDARRRLREHAEALGVRAPEEADKP